MLKTLIDIAREGGELALDMKSRPLERTSKDGKAWNLVTKADPAVEKLIMRRLAKEFPDIQTVGEEQDKHNIPSGRFFTVDPIDGTIAFAHGFDNWAVILGHIANGQVEHGVIYLPERNILIAAQRGKGCTVNGELVTMNCTQTLAESVVGIDIGPWVPDDKWSFLSRLRLKCQWLGGSGMAAASIVDILLGRSVAYPNFCAKIWDFSAGALALTEAGGIARYPNGQDLRWDEINMQAIFSANEEIAKEIQALVGS